jgi:hypothetical protein
MRKAIRALVLAFALALTSVGAAAQNDPISEIRREYALIERELPGYEHSRIELEGFSAEGGTMDVFRDGGGPRKLFATHYGETGRAFESYYYREGALFFVLRVTERYDAPLSGRVVEHTEERFYFAGDSLIRRLDSRGRPAAVEGAEAARESGELLDQAHRLMAVAGGGVSRASPRRR